MTLLHALVLACARWRAAARSPAAALCLVALGLVWAAAQANAQTPPELVAGTAPIPVGGTGGRLASQIVDVGLEEVDGVVTATVQSVFQIRNTDKQEARVITVSLPVDLPGGLTFAPRALSGVAVRVDGRDRVVRRLPSALPSVSPGITESLGYPLVLNVPADGTSVVQLNYLQNLGTGPRPAFRFATSSGSEWPGPVGSSRVTVRFPWPTTREQVIDAVPDGASFDGQQLTWYQTDFEPQDNIRLTFVRPGFWQEINDARAAATENPGSAEARYRLASLYRQLTGAGGAAFEALAMGELEATRQAADSAGSGLRCRASKELADFHQGRAQRPDGSVDSLALAQAMREWDSVAQSCPPAEAGPEVGRKLREGNLYLAREARDQGRFETALAYLDSAEGAPTAGPGAVQQSLAGERRLAYLYWVRDLLDRGDSLRALEIADRGLRPEDLAPVKALSPRFSEIQMSVATDPGRRKIRLSLQPYPPPSLDEAGREPAESLKELTQAVLNSPFQVSQGDGNYLLEAALPFESSEDLLRQQAALLQVLPDWPELAFVREALSPQRAELAVDQSWFTTRARYAETVDTRGAAALYAEEARAVAQEQARLEPGPAAGERGPEAETLAAIRRQALVLARDAWQSLLDDSRASFSIEWQPLTGDRIQRAWPVKAGQSQEMRLESQAYNQSSIMTAAGLALLGVVIVVLILLLVGRLSR